MKYALIAILLTALAFGQDTTPSNPDNSTPAPAASQPVPTDQANAQKARQILNQAIEALGGQAYLTFTDEKQEGRAYKFHHGEPNSMGLVFWRFTKFPDKDRVEFTKKRDVVQIFNGDKGFEITYKGVRPLEQKDELAPYLRRHHYALDIVLRQWLNQPGVALFYEGQTVAAQKETDQVTLMNNKNEAVTLYIDINTHLPVKESFSWRDPADKQRNVEDEIFDNYRSIQKIMTPFDTTRMYNGEMSAQTFLTGASYNEDISDTLFDPETPHSSKRH
jgi:hypothetical protein